MTFLQRLGLLSTIVAVVGLFSKNADPVFQVVITLLWLVGGALFLYDNSMISKDKL